MKRITKTNILLTLSCLFFAFFIYSFGFGSSSAYAAATQSTLSLSINTNNLLVDLMPTESGTFGTSDNATISVSTNNYTGYTLKIASTNGTNLINSDTNDVISSLSSSISTSAFSSNSAYNNQWGYKPSQYVTTSGNTNTIVNNSSTYLPSPSSAGDLLDITNGANSTAKTYTINIGARVDTSLSSGIYSNSFIIYAIGNTITYSINYNANTEDTVSNMPSTNPQTVDIAGGTAAGSSYATLSNATPTRTGYTFGGWCDTATTTNQNTGSQTCPGNTTAAGGQLGLDQTTNPNLNLYAIWTIKSYTITLNKNGATNTPTSSTTVNYGATTLNTIATLPTKSGYTISGFTTPPSNNASYTTVSSTSTITAANNFNGWHQTNGTGTLIADNSSTPALQANTAYTDTNGKWTYNNNTTLYAGWTTQSKTLPTITKTGGFSCGWTTTSSGATDYMYASGASITPSANTTLYGVCKCPANTICYDSNSTGQADGTMSGQTISSSSTSATLIASNYSYIEHGYAGWNTNANNTGTNYGPQETITFAAGQYSNTGLTLYAHWISAGQDLQGWTGCPNMNIGEVTALFDQRDNEAYAVAKLDDGNCWMIENLRLEANNTIGNTNELLAQGYGKSTTYGNFSGLATAESANYDDTNPPVANSLYSTNGTTTNTIQGGDSTYYYARMPRYNNLNTQSRASSPNNNSSSIYSYGNYYTWPATMANIKQYNSPTSTDDEGKTSETANTSLCPAGWRLPRGGNKSREYTNDFWSLIVNGINNGNNPANYDSSTAPYYTGSTENSVINALRSYPNNFLYSGGFRNSSVYNNGSVGYYWSSTASNNYSSYFMAMGGTSLYPGTSNYVKYNGYSIRCILPQHFTIILDNNGATTTGSTYANVDLGSTTLSTITNPSKSNTTNTRTVSGFTLTPSGANATVSSTDTLNSTQTTTYTFNGWHETSSTSSTLIASNATTPVLQANTSYTNANGEWTNHDSVTLYAGWIATTGSYTSITLPTITRTGSTCGWSTSSTATTITYTSGQTITPTSNLTLYGVCVQNITLNLNGGTGGSTSAQVLYNDTKITANNSGTSAGGDLTNPTKGNFTVSGWSAPTSNNANGTTINGGTTPSSLSATNTFNGWHLSSGTGTKIASNAVKPALQASISGYTDANNKWTRTAAGALTFYAGWTTSSVTLPTITKSGYTCGWTETSSNATSITYASGASMTPSKTTTTLYGVCTCPANKICYHANGGTGTMAQQSITSSDTYAILWTGNFSKSNVGFAGWNTQSNGAGTNYGPNQTLTFSAGTYSSKGLILYAHWITPESTDMQSWSCPNNTNMPVHSVVALKDVRDNNVYTVAKLADGKCWMVENLRLNYAGSRGDNVSNTQGYAGVMAGLASSEDAARFSNVTTANGLYSIDGSTSYTISGSDQSRRFPRYNNQNTASRATNATNEGNVYSKGHYYSFAAAIGDTTRYATNNASRVNTSICPLGWRLPRAGSDYNSGKGYSEWYNLAKAEIGVDPNEVFDTDPDGNNRSRYNNVGSGTQGNTASRTMRAYPVNMIFNGYIDSGTLRQDNYATYWSSTTENETNAYMFHLTGSLVSTTNYIQKSSGASIRCIKI